MMSNSAGGIAVNLTNVRKELLKKVKTIPGLSDGRLSGKFFMIVKTPYQVPDKPKRLPSRDFIDQDRLYEAHECDKKGMLIDKGLRVSFMLSDDAHDDSAVMRRPKFVGQREPRENKASDGARYSRKMESPELTTRMVMSKKLRGMKMAYSLKMPQKNITKMELS